MFVPAVSVVAGTPSECRTRSRHAVLLYERFTRQHAFDSARSSHLHLTALCGALSCVQLLVAGERSHIDHQFTRTSGQSERVPILQALLQLASLLLIPQSDGRGADRRCAARQVGAAMAVRRAPALVLAAVLLAAAAHAQSVLNPDYQAQHLLDGRERGVQALPVQLRCAHQSHSACCTHTCTNLMRPSLIAPQDDTTLSPNTTESGMNLIQSEDGVGTFAGRTLSSSAATGPTSLLNNYADASGWSDTYAYVPTLFATTFVSRCGEGQHNDVSVCSMRTFCPDSETAAF